MWDKMDKITAKILAEVTGRILLPFTKMMKPGKGTDLSAEHCKFSFRT